jgi:hypothetical protein
VSRSGKLGIVSVILVLAVLLAVVAPAHKRRGFYVVSSGLALVALYIARRVKTWDPPPPTSIVEDVDGFIADHGAHTARFEDGASGKRERTTERPLDEAAASGGGGGARAAVDLLAARSRALQSP